LARQPAQLLPDGALAAESALLTLKADMSLVISVFLHVGQRTSAERLSTSSSNVVRHVLQRNSYKGMTAPRSVVIN
jgi:hypothetical protein